MSRLVTNEMYDAHPERYRGGHNSCMACLEQDTTTGFQLRRPPMGSEISEAEWELLRSHAAKLRFRLKESINFGGFALCRDCSEELDIPVWEIRPEIPQWECGGNYAKAVDGTLRTQTEINVRHLLDGDELTPGTDILLEAMLRAHIATLDLDQYHALPDDDEYLDYTPDQHLLFDPLYVSVGAEDCAGVLLATMIARDDGRRGVSAVRFQEEEGMLRLVSAFSLEEARRDPAIKVAHFLESFNVDIEEAHPSRQVRRNAERKGLPIAMRVYVHSNNKRYAKRNGQPSEARYEYRFEVRGHYRHSGPDTPVFKATQRDRPEKIIEHPTRGPIVRKWIPPYIKGDPDKPLVPKVRVITKNQNGGDQ